MKKLTLFTAVFVFTSLVAATHGSAETPNTTEDYVDQVTLKGRFDTEVMENGSVKLQLELRDLRENDINHLDLQARQDGYRNMKDFFRSEYGASSEVVSSEIPSFYRNFDFRIYRQFSPEELQDLSNFNLTLKNESVEVNQRITYSAEGNYGSVEELFLETKAVMPYYTLTMPSNITSFNMPNGSVSGNKVQHRFEADLREEDLVVEASSPLPERERKNAGGFFQELMSFVERLI